MDQSSPPLIGNRYRIENLLGEGGMGAVFRGVDTQTGETVAVKLLKPELVRFDAGQVERFNREAEALRQLNHPNIVKVYETLEDHDKHYIVMEYVGGGSLQDLLRKGEIQSVKRVQQIGLELADALTRSHHLQIVHRDLKPGNVMIAQDDSVRLTDFGVAQFAAKERVTQSGVIVGTADYLAPEVLEGHDQDQRADIWAFGVILFELLTGQRPFAGETISQVIAAILTKPLPDLELLRPDVSLPMVDLVYRMLEKDPNKRIPSARLVGAELEIILKVAPDAAPSTRPITLPPKSELLQGKMYLASTPIVNRLRNNLPIQTTPFVERENELADLRKLITDTQSPIITIVAPGGMGKTRLALELGTQFATERADLAVFPNGILFVQLAPLVSADSIAEAIAEAGEIVLASSDAEPKQHLFNYFREKRLLLILDNFEHVLDGAALVSEIVEAAPGVRVLVTSRERLNLQGETVFRLDGMAFPKQDGTGDARSFNSVKLFVQSATQLQPKFDLSGDALNHVTRICQLVDGLPLGIIMAASWIETLSPHEIADEIASSLDFLESESRNVPERQRSIRAVFDYSWRLLSDVEQPSMMKLSVFRGGFTREAAQAVAGAQLRLLASFVNKSLLRRDPASGRYDVHELVRQYAEEKLRQSGLLDQTRTAHLDYFAAFAEQANEQLKGAGQTEWVNRLEADHDNLRAALTWAYGAGSAEQGLRIAVGTWLFWFRLGYVREGLDWLQKGLAQTEGVTTLRALAWNASAIAGGNSGDSRAAEFGMKAIEYGQQLGLKAIVGMNQYVVQTFATSDFDAASQLFDTGVAMIREQRDTYTLQIALAMFGGRSRVQGDFERAERLWNECLETARATKNDHFIALAMGDLGRLAVHRRDYPRATQLLEQAVRLLRKIGFRLDVAEMLIHLGTVQMYQGQYSDAEQSLTESLALWRDIGQLTGVAHALHCLANIKLHQGDIQQATVVMRDCFRVIDQNKREFLNALLVEFSVVRLLIVGRLACRWGGHEQAAQLLAACSALALQAHFRLEPTSQDEFEAAALEVRSRLGDVQFLALWTEGQKLDEATALQQARGYLDSLQLTLA